MTGEPPPAAAPPPSGAPAAPEPPETAVAAAAISFRPVDHDADAELLFRIYAGTRTEELAAVPWSDAQKIAFLQMQFNAQAADYRVNYPTAEFLVILVAGEPAGRLYIDRSTAEINLIDIALLPARRGAGVGGAILRDILAAAAASARPVRIHVERFNPALRLYERLGFRQIADGGIYLLMEWTPPG